MGSDWEWWGVVSYRGGSLGVLIRAGAPTRRLLSDGLVAADGGPAVLGDHAATTQRWCHVVFYAFETDQEREDALRRLVEDAELRDAFLAVLQLGGSQRATAFVRAAVHL